MCHTDAPSASVLFERPQHLVPGAQLDRRDALFSDLNLDQVVRAVLAHGEGYDIAELFYAPLQDPGAVRYRQEVCQDLESPDVAACTRRFSEQMAATQRYLRGADQVEDRHYKQGWFLDAAESYCAAVSDLAAGLDQLPLRAAGMLGLREYLRAYRASPAFVSLRAEIAERRRSLAEVQYAIRIKGRSVSVHAYDGEADYSAEIEQTFAKFRQGAVRDFRRDLPDQRDANHVHAQVLDGVARLYPDVFAELDATWERHRGFVDATVAAFDVQVHFYLAYLELIRPLEAAGLPFCYPVASQHPEEVHVEQAFDVALANILVPKGASVVCNDLDLSGPERVLVVTGPNQGGKTTFARMFGQLHYLASLGLPVPGRLARLGLPDRIFTHFDKQERLEDMRGKLEDELVRVREILERATADSVLVMNESFSSTTLADALFIGSNVLKKVTALGALCVYVTFVDELAGLNEATVSVVSDVAADNPELRTFKLTRRPADGKAYAMALARSYDLAYGPLRDRLLAQGQGPTQGQAPA